MKALYFADKDKKLKYGDGRSIVVGETHTVDCKPICCKSGLHGSIKVIDALSYAPGHTLYLVDINGAIDESDDKICGKNRKYISEVDLTETLGEFAKSQALVNIDKIKDYCQEDDFNVVLSFLKGEETLRSAAWSAAEAAAESAAEAAAAEAAWSAWSAAEAASSAAEAAAAWSAAEAAARSSAVSAVWSAAESAAWSAANNLLCDMIEKETGWDLSFSRCNNE